MVRMSSTVTRSLVLSAFLAGLLALISVLYVTTRPTPQAGASEPLAHRVFCKPGHNRHHKGHHHASHHRKNHHQKHPNQGHHLGHHHGRHHDAPCGRHRQPRPPGPRPTVTIIVTPTPPRATPTPPRPTPTPSCTTIPGGYNQPPQTICTTPSP